MSENMFSEAISDGAQLAKNKIFHIKNTKNVRKAVFRHIGRM